MNPEREIRDYLLGALPPGRREEIEQRIMSDDDFHLEIELAEDELLDDYARERLPEPERRLFEANFLASPLRQQRLKFARALQDKIKLPSPPPPPPFPIRLYSYALAAFFIIMVCLGAWNYQLAKSIREERARTASLTRQLETARLHAVVIPNSIFPTPELVPNSSRSGPQPELVLPHGIEAVRFTLVVPTSFLAPVRVDLLNDSGQTIFSQQGIQIKQGQRQNLVSATIEANYLNPGNYVLRLTSHGSASFPEYAFKVLRSPE